jgi:hypothetical protein
VAQGAVAALGVKHVYLGGDSLSPLSAFPLATTRLSCILRPRVAHHYNADSICKPMVYVM